MPSAFSRASASALPTVLRAAILLAVAALYLAPLPSSAHAGLVAVDPAEGAVVAELPETVTLTFSEPVTNAELAVSAPDGSWLDVEPRAQDREVVADLPVPPPAQDRDGTFTVAYRVVSGDGHPVTGQWSFEVGTEAAAARQAATSGTTEGVAQESFVHRHAEHIAWIGGAGVVAVVLILWPLLRRRES